MLRFKGLCKKVVPFAVIAALTGCILLMQNFLPNVPCNMYFSSIGTLRQKPPDMSAHCIDVGQGDSTYIQLPYYNQNMLIDAGRLQYGQTVVDYIKNEKPKTKAIDYFVLTHPDNDHIGGALTVIDNFEIKGCYLPYAVHTTDNYKNLLKRLQEKEIPVHFIGYDTEKNAPFLLINQSNFKVEVLAPISDTYAELNNYSVVLKLIYYDTSMLFTGDAEELAEEEMISKGLDLKVDLLHVGHHGSQNSTSQVFLKAVSPRYGIISDGREYGHPTTETLARLKEHNVGIYRTDESGTIVATSDGNQITIETEHEPRQANAPPETAAPTILEPQQGTDAPSTNAPTTMPKQDSTEAVKNLDNVIVWLADNPSVYHTNKNCSYLEQTRNKGHENTITLGEAKKQWKKCPKCPAPSVQ